MQRSAVGMSKQTKGAFERFLEDMRSEHVRKRKRKQRGYRVKEKRWVGEVDNGHPRWGLVNQGSNSGDPQPLYELSVFNPAFPDEEVETRRDQVTSPKEGLNLKTNPGLPVPKLNPKAPNIVGVPSRGGPWSPDRCTDLLEDTDPSLPLTSNSAK